VLTPLTVYRNHPVESLFFALRGVLATGLVTGIFFHLFRGRAVQADILGANAIGFVFNLVGGNLRHSHVWISYGRFLERILISPAQHQIHHSSDPSHYGRNFGSWLAIWDGLGGSLHLAGTERPLDFGLKVPDRNHDPRGLISALVRPVTGSVRVLGMSLGGPWRGIVVLVLGIILKP
jgi:sterol desaturase/sphingolipid hydroxylase (fatty acid hydroxylase superfamily)